MQSGQFVRCRSLERSDSGQYPPGPSRHLADKLARALYRLWVPDKLPMGVAIARVYKGHKCMQHQQQEQQHGI